ncbi:MAG: hypothetical protein ACHQQQ_14925 [Bacteroidota bacterium]
MGGSDRPKTISSPALSHAELGSASAFANFWILKQVQDDKLFLLG